MTSRELLALLAERRVFLSGEGGTLKFRAPEGAVDSGLRELLRQEKGGLLQALRARPGHLLLSPLSFNQHSLYFLHLLEPDSAAYNLALSMRLKSDADAAAMRLALERLVLRHEQLRTTYGHLDLGGMPVPAQFVHEHLSPAFETIEASGWTDAELAGRVRTFYRTPMDLEAGPVVRAGLFICGAGASVLVVVVPHIAADGRSMSLILRDLSAACRGELEQGRREPARAEYTDFVAAQHRLLGDPSGRAHVEYWAAIHTPPAPPLDLGSEVRRPAVRRSAGATHYLRIESSLRAAVERAAREEGVTAFSLLLSVFQWVLLARSGQRDVVVGIPTLGRTDSRFEDCVGYFVNPVPLRCRRVGSPSFREHARATAQEFREALEHREAPFAAVVERLGGTRDAARTPVFQVLFNFLSRKTLGDVVDIFYPAEAPVAVDLAGMKATAYPLDQQEGQFDLTLELIERSDDILGLVKYCTDLFTPGEAGSLAAEFLRRLESAVADPGLLLFTEPGEAVRDLPAEDKPVLAVAATFTAEVFQEFFDFWFRRLDWDVAVRFAPFSQVFQELLSPESLLRGNRKGHDLVLLRFEDLLGGGDRSPADGVAELRARLPPVLDDVLQAVETASRAVSVPLCIVVCPSSPRFEEIAREASEAVDRFLEALRRIPGTVVLTHEDVVRRYPVPEYHEPLGETLARIPFTRPYQAALSAAVVRSLLALSRKPVKALVVDCDGTLWEGVAAEDGPRGVSIGPPVQKFQEFLLEQYRAGVMLCLCSKNREDDVWAVFDQNPAMLVRREHVAFWRVNWESKSVNLPALAAEMNIGLDAVAFLDDNPVERSEIRASCPAVFCPELPGDWAERAGWLEHLWVLDHPRATGDDRKRQEHYRTDRLRADLKRGAGSLSDFLEKLELRVDLRPADSSTFERLAQLSVRTNQFNTTTLRLSPQEAAAYVAEPRQAAYVAFVSDRFGDYGLVGGMFVRATAGLLRVEGMLLSCRALGRGVEHRMAAHLAGVARENGCGRVAFPCRATERNEPARKFLAQLAEECSGSRDDDGTLLVDAALLSAIRYQPRDGVAPASPGQESTAGPDLEVHAQRELAGHIASDCRTVGQILAALDEESRARRSGAVIPLVATAPETTTERVLASVWRRALGLDEIDTQANFFELGGTSLLMARVAIEVRRDHGLAVSIVDLFHYPTIAALARHLDRGGAGVERPALVAAGAPRQRDAPGRPELPAAFLRLKKARGK